MIDQEERKELERTVEKEYPLIASRYYDAAPRFAYPDFISDLYVVAVAKWDSCGLEDRDHHSVKMIVGDSTPEFMYYHPEEMGFGGPYVYFIWEDDGWIMTFGKKECRDERDRNMNIHRFLAMRRAGYPVVYFG
jgi:hypothetical protein